MAKLSPKQLRWFFAHLADRQAEKQSAAADEAQERADSQKALAEYQQKNPLAKRLRIEKPLSGVRGYTSFSGNRAGTGGVNVSMYPQQVKATALHETVHLEQYDRLGRRKFATAAVAGGLMLPYAWRPLEREAWKRTIEGAEDAHTRVRLRREWAAHKRQAIPSAIGEAAALGVSGAVVAGVIKNRKKLLAGAARFLTRG